MEYGQNLKSKKANNKEKDTKLGNKGGISKKTKFQQSEGRS